MRVLLDTTRLTIFCQAALLAVVNRKVSELRVLREDKKELNDEFKGKINQKMISKIVRLVKIKLDLDDLKASPETIEEIEDLVKEKINMVV